MPARWADTLAPEKPYAETFRGLLVQRIEQDFEAEDDIVQGVIDALLEVDTKQALDAELEPIFDEGYEGISNWCWETLEQHTSKQTEPSQPETPDSSTTNSSAPTASAAAATADEQKSQQSKRPPIRFNLDASAPDTAPKKASDSKAQQLNVGKPAKPSDPADTKQAPGPKQPPAAEQQSRPDAQSQPTRPGAAAGSSSGTAGPRQRGGAGAPAASARLLHMTGLIRPTDGGPGNSSRDSRPRGRQHEQQARPEAPSKGSQPHHHPQQQAQPNDRKRALEEPHERDSRCSSRRGPAAAAAAVPGSMFRNALGGLRSDRPDRSPKPQHGSDAPAAQQQQQPQQQSGHTSVFDRINRADLARIGGPQAQQHQQQQQAPAAKQQQQLAPPIAGLPKSLQGRVGIITSSNAAPAAARGGHMQPDRPQPAAGSAGSPAAGSKRKALETPQVPATYSAAAAAAAAAGAAAAAAAPAKPAASTGHLVQQTPAQQQVQQVQGGRPAKKSRTAAPAAAAAAPAGSAPAAAPGSKEAELAALRAQLQARQAEVQRLKQAQEADQVSVAVFGVSPRVPDVVLKAHFESCGASCGAKIKRCTMLTGRYPPPHASAPGAFLEFVGVAEGASDAAKAKAAQQATTNALQLSGSMLLDQKITVVRKAEWQASVAKGQRSYTAMRSGPTPTAGSTSRSWTGAASAAAGGASAGGTGVAAAPAAGVTES